MDKDFNDLFNEFFKNGFNKRLFKGGLDADGKMDYSSLPEDIQKLMKSLSDVKAREGEINLGEPMSIEHFEKDGLNYTKSTWEIEGGGFISRIKLEGDIPLSIRNRANDISNKVEISLEKQLQIAKDDENYELCAKLRDEIVALEEKDKASENLNNKGLPENDGWNF